ncbi:hypothetical protein GCM10010201_14790 [Pilimelia columellifera subsp. columellifera]|uniref:Uncharacterized protein n=1 Tax=Pilimelia columellifera subsp. columellifera TaxID=706583 RepID=A0ABN3NDG8_9ACTN
MQEDSRQGVLADMHRDAVRDLPGELVAVGAADGGQRGEGCGQVLVPAHGPAVDLSAQPGERPVQGGDEAQLGGGGRGPLPRWSWGQTVTGPVVDPSGGAAHSAGESVDAGGGPLGQPVAAEPRCARV